MKLDAYRLFLLDMDDTLFEERDFVLSGLSAVAAYVARWGLCPTAARAFLQNRFAQHGRQNILQHLLSHFAVEAGPARIDQLVAVYRSHDPDIHLYRDVEKVLERLRGQGRVVVVTDGLAAVQQRKYKALGLDAMVDQVVYCQAVGYPKPDARALDGVVCAGAADAVLVGDRPDHDLALAAHRGIASIRVRTGRFAHASHAPWQPIADLDSIMALGSLLG